MKSPNQCPACRREEQTGEPVSRHDLPLPKKGTAVTVNIGPPEPEIRLVPVLVEGRLRR